MIEVAESIKKREMKTTRAQYMRERASFSHLSKVRRIIPVLRFHGEWSPDPWYQAWTYLLSFISSFLVLLSVVLCRLYI